MTQDQYDQTRGPGYVVHDDAFPDEENEEYAGQSRPKTAFQKVASALRGDRDEADQGQPGANPPWVTNPDEAAMANSPISQEAQGTAGTTEASAAGSAGITGTGARQDDYWDRPGTTATDRDEAVAMTSPDGPVPADVSDTDPLTRQDQVTGQTQPGRRGSPGDSAGHVRHQHAPYFRGQRSHLGAVPPEPGRRGCPSRYRVAAKRGGRDAG